MDPGLKMHIVYWKCYVSLPEGNYGVVWKSSFVRERGYFFVFVGWVGWNWDVVSNKNTCEHSCVDVTVWGYERPMRVILWWFESDFSSRNDIYRWLLSEELNLHFHVCKVGTYIYIDLHIIYVYCSNMLKKNRWTYHLTHSGPNFVARKYTSIPYTHFPKWLGTTVDGRNPAPPWVYQTP